MRIPIEHYYIMFANINYVLPQYLLDPLAAGYR